MKPKMQQQELARRKCRPFEEGEPALSGAELDELASLLDDTWTIIDDDRLQKEYEFANFRDALDFTNAVGEIAEQENHHPDIELGWGRVLVQFRTHKVDGLSMNDFIMAAKTDEARPGA